MQSKSPTVIRLRAGAFAAWAAGEGLLSETAQAERIGVSPTTLNRILRGVIVPGEGFIGAALTATGATFEQLFRIEAS
jgi:hypothetical protein